MAKILVIDDYQAIRNLYKTSLETRGHQVTTAENAEQGLSYMLQGGYDLILLDLLMPKKGALWLLDQLKLHTPQLPNGHIILMSFDGDDQETKDALDQALHNGAYGVFDKKTPIEQFTNKITDFLKE